MPEATLVSGGESSQEQQQQTTQQTQQTQQAQAPTGFVGDDGKFKDGWLDRLPPDFADSKQILGKYTNLPDTLKAFVEAQKLIGKKQEGMIRIPGALKEGATEAEKTAHQASLAEYRKAIGVPEKADGYTLKPETMPEGLEWDDNQAKAFAEIAHAHNIPPAAMKALSDAFVSAEGAKVTAQQQLVQQELEKGKTTLQDAWKGNFDANLKTATRVAKTLGLPLESPGLRDPEMVKALHKMAGMVSEDKLISGEFSGSSTPGKDRGMAIISGKTSDPEILRLHEAYNKGDQATNKMVLELLENG